MPTPKPRDGRGQPDIKDPKPDRDIDIDDAQIEPPRDDAFKKGDRPPAEKQRT